MLIVHLLPHVFSSPSFPAFDLRSSSRAAVLSTAYDDYEDLKMQVEDLDVQLPPEERAALAPLVAPRPPPMARSQRTDSRSSANACASDLATRLWIAEAAWVASWSRPLATAVQTAAMRSRVCWLAARRRGGAARAACCVRWCRSRSDSTIAGRLRRRVALGGWRRALGMHVRVFMQHTVRRRAERAAEALASAMRLHERVAVFRPWVDGLDGFSDPTTVQCETSWSADTPGRSVLGVELMASGTSTVYVYERRASFLPAWWTDQLDGALIGLGIVLVGTVLGLFLVGPVTRGDSTRRCGRRGGRRAARRTPPHRPSAARC